MLDPHAQDVTPFVLVDVVTPSAGIPVAER